MFFDVLAGFSNKLGQRSKLKKKVKILEDVLCINYLSCCFEMDLVSIVPNIKVQMQCFMAIIYTYTNFIKRKDYFKCFFVMNMLRN